jgi:cleavage stimulation factor subunit 2
VGQVLNFRLVYDKETGRPKGFGFAEFADGDAAASAVRNLNDYEIMGRKLRVDWSNDNGAGDSAPSTYSAPAPQPPMGQPEPAQAQPSTSLPTLPPGTALEPGLTAGDAISRTLSTLPAPQLLDILAQMKGLVMNDTARATELLTQAPQLAYALFQALLLLNLVDASVLAQVVDPAPPQPAAAPQHVPQQPPPQHAYPGYPPQQAPTPVHAQPPQQHQPYQQAPPAIPAALAAMPPEQQQQYLQILQLTPDQVGALPPEHRKQIMDIRAMFGM